MIMNTSEFRKALQNRSSASSRSKLPSPMKVPRSAKPGQSSSAYHQLATSG
jgi:hypothetical protein